MTDNQQSELASMSHLDILSPTLLNEPDMPQNLLDEQPRRRANPLI